MGSAVVLEAVSAAVGPFGCVPDADFSVCLARNDVGDADYSPMPGKMGSGRAGVQPLGASSPHPRSSILSGPVFFRDVG